MIIGYARVSTLDQNLELQRDALEKSGCEQVFEEYVSGASTERPGWAQAQAVLRKGDTLVVWRLDRLGRSLKQLIDTVNELDSRGAGLKSLNETSTRQFTSDVSLSTPSVSPQRPPIHRRWGRNRLGTSNTVVD